MNRGLTVLVMVLATVLATSCAEVFEPANTVYLIKKGNHESQVAGGISKGVRTLKSTQMTISVWFDETARYDLKNNDQGDINKLFGFADCNSLHHENSARFGWNYNLETEEIDIYWYVYAQGQREYEKMGSMPIGEKRDLSILLMGDEYEFNFDGNVRTVKRGADCDRGIYYLLYPYFGGDETAPQDIRIYIKETL